MLVERVSLPGRNQYQGEAQSYIDYLAIETTIEYRYTRVRSLYIDLLASY